MTNSEKITDILRHIKRVVSNCDLLASHFIETNLEFALGLIVRGRNHDSSKFSSYQFESPCIGTSLHNF